MAPAEIAVALPALVLVTALVLWGVTAASAQLACADAVRSGARAAARGEPPDAVRALVVRSVPRGAYVRVVRDADISRVEVTVPVKAPGGARLPPLRIHANATAINEPGAGEEAGAGGLPPPATTVGGDRP